MAIWQYPLDVIPKKSLIEKYGEIPKGLFYDTEDWKNYWGDLVEIKTTNKKILIFFTMTFPLKIFPYYIRLMRQSQERSPLEDENRHKFQQNLIQKQSHYLWWHY